MTSTAFAIAEVVPVYGTTDRWAGWCDNCGMSSMEHPIPSAPQFEQPISYTMEFAQGWVDGHNFSRHPDGVQGTRSNPSRKAQR